MTTRASQSALGDWLRPAGHSRPLQPLTQLTAKRTDLHLACVSPMAKRTNQPRRSPQRDDLVNNTGGTIQALDGKTGDLIWEQRLGSNTASRGISLYEDKLYIAMSNAHLVALDAKTGKVVWDVLMPDGRGSSSGPLVAKGKIIQGMGGCSQYVEQKCFISAYDAKTGKQLWRFHTIAREANPRRFWAPDDLSAPAREWITGRYDSELISPIGAPQAKPGMPVSRGCYARQALTRALHRARRDTARLRGILARTRRSASISTSYSSACSWIRKTEPGFTPAMTGAGAIADGQYLGHKETTFQNVWEKFDPQTGTPTYRADIIDHEVGQWIDSCPSTEGGHNWQAMSHHRGTNQLIIPLSQSCLSIRAQKIEQRAGGGSGGGADRRFYEMPGTDGNIGKLPAYDVNSRRRSGRCSIARRSSPQCSRRRRRRLRRRPRSIVQAIDVRTGKVLWQTPWPRGARLPISFSVDGKQYIAVTTGSVAAARGSCRPPCTRDSRPDHDSSYVFALLRKIAPD